MSLVIIGECIVLQSQCFW